MTQSCMDFFLNFNTDRTPTMNSYYRKNYNCIPNYTKIAMSASAFIVIKCQNLNAITVLWKPRITLVHNLKF